MNFQGPEILHHRCQVVAVNLYNQLCVKPQEKHFLPIRAQYSLLYHYAHISTYIPVTMALYFLV